MFGTCAYSGGGGILGGQMPPPPHRLSKKTSKIREKRGKGKKMKENGLKRLKTKIVVII